ncbi:hypothetical protein BCR43DRAFT_136361 [Syncephalastrum racemosum]|uniref:C2H2-type domain-containing protein n=1 Tax=Syncephalastrum racemosum TaxID=13706 RepID=A0A1X2HLW5_SYNRA|nr:hypothetical protein BCR43DRAFT_136361 [Syncephalastrum racemosum]
MPYPEAVATVAKRDAPCRDVTQSRHPTMGLPNSRGSKYHHNNSIHNNHSMCCTTVRVIKICPLEMPGNKWRSPETATMSSASSLCSPDATDNSQDPWAQFDIKQQQAAAEDRHVEELSNGAHEESGAEEDEKLHCMWSDCGLELDVLEDLIAHVKDVHIGSGKALYYCEWKDCPRNQKPFTKRHKMHNHLRTHTGERPFECAEPGCGKRFSRPDSLTTHAKIHSNVRPYLCQFENCGKAYYHLRSLRKHERSHELRLDDEPVPPIPPVPSQLSHVMTRNSNSVTQHPDASGGLVSLSDDTLLDWCSATPVSSTATAADVVNITATSSTF